MGKNKFEWRKPKIAEVRVAYKHREIIELLKTRGSIIEDEVDLIYQVKADHDIAKYIKENEETLKEPVCAFVTFNSAEPTSAYDH